MFYFPPNCRTINQLDQDKTKYSYLSVFQSSTIIMKPELLFIAFVPQKNKEICFEGRVQNAKGIRAHFSTYLLVH